MPLIFDFGTHFRLEILQSIRGSGVRVPPSGPKGSGVVQLVEQQIIPSLWSIIGVSRFLGV